jgi:hypothetical protein
MSQTNYGDARQQHVEERGWHCSLEVAVPHRENSVPPPVEIIRVLARGAVAQDLHQ